MMKSESTNHLTVLSKNSKEAGSSNASKSLFKKLSQDSLKKVQTSKENPLSSRNSQDSLQFQNRTINPRMQQGQVQDEEEHL